MVSLAMLSAPAAAPETSVALSIETFIEELASVLPALVPEARIVRGEHSLFFRRGVASAEIVKCDRSTLVLVLRQRGEKLLHAAIPATARGLNDLAADLVGYFCGAPLVTLAVFPQRGERARLPVSRRRRRVQQDVPLIRIAPHPDYGEHRLGDALSARR